MSTVIITACRSCGSEGAQSRHILLLTADLFASYYSNMSTFTFFECNGCSESESEISGFHKR
jgi:hypothetical protein